MRRLPQRTATARRGQSAPPTLRPVAAAFVGFGVFWGSWSVAVADIEHELRLSHGTFGLLLSAGLAAGGVANALGGALAERHGSGRVLAGVARGVGVALARGDAWRTQRLALGASPRSRRSRPAVSSTP